MTKPVLVHNFDPLGQFKQGISSGPPWESIVDFATHKSFCNKRLYPRQMTLLKLMYLETETMTDYDREVIGGWAESFKNFHAPMGVQPDIWDRVNYLKSNGFTHFPHIQMVMGRRASKGIMGGIVGCERIAWLYSLGSWQQHFNQVPGQVAELMVVANSLSQAVTRQFRDIRNTVLNCEYLRPHIVSDKQCVDEDTEILTKRGWLKHADLQAGDETLGLHEDGTVSWTRVNRVSRYPGHHDMVHWQSRGHDSLTTPNHRWLVEWWGNQTDKTGMRWTRSDRLGDKANEAVICGRELVEYPEQKYTDALVELVAWYWTEGHLNKWNGISIAQNRRANPEKWASIQAALISCFGEAKDSGSRGREFYVGSKDGKAEQVWRHAPGKDKVLSLDFILSLTKAQLRLFVDTSIAGDGHVHTDINGKVTKTTIFQKSKESLDVFQIACQLLGKQTSLMRQPFGRTSYSHGEKDGWRLNIYSRSRVLPASARRTGKIKDVTYDGIVWCPSTETGTWLARRNGQVYFTGNTEFYIRTPGDIQTIEENRLAGISSEREIATIYCKASSSVSTSGRGGTAIAIFYDEMAHMLAGTGSTKTGEEIYDAFQPSLDQFGSAAMTYLASSPFSKIGKFYDLYQQGRVTMDEYNQREGKLKTSSFIEEAAAQDIDLEPDEISSAVAEPTFLVVQLPSWETYKDWEISREIPIRPNRTRTFPRWNSPVQFEPISDGSPDERVQFRRMQRNPDKFKVERGAQFATVQDAYLNEVMVDRMFLPPNWREPLVEQYQGKLSIAYRAHADPSRTNANFGFCIAHLEEAPPDEHGISWPHVIIDVLKVWKPEDFPQHTIDYVQVGEELDGYLTRFPSMVKMSYDQFNSAGFIAHQKRAFTNIRIVEKTFTVRENQDRFEKFKSALNLGWVHCLAGETNVLTPDGPRSIRDLVGTTARLLTTSQNDGRGGGKWVDAPVRSFGVQPLLKVTLRRNGVDKVIHATAGHRWFVRTTNGTASRRDEVLTTDLQPGQKLSYCYAQRHKATRPSPIGIAHGFTYGDGTRSRKGSVAQFCGDKDKALIPYFDLHPIVDIAPGVRRALDLPRFFKEKVDLTESPSYLYGWLAGYMAADGHVTKDGRVEIDSNDRSSIEHVRAVCNILGVHTTTIRTKGAYGHGYNPDGQGYATNLDTAALTEEFFLIEEHRRRWVDNQDTTRKDYRGYTVVAVEETDRVEEVFCAVVEGTHSFTLEDNILTGNCFKDSYAEEGQSLLELELKFLQEKNGKVDKQEIGPIQTKDLSDAVMVVTTELLHESLDRWWKAINRTSVGSTNIDGLRSGRDQERLQYFQNDKTQYTDPLQRYLAEEAERNERKSLRAERNRQALENSKIERARRNAFGTRSPYTGNRTRGNR